MSEKTTNGKYLARRYWPQINTRIHPELEAKVKQRVMAFGITVQQVINEALNDHFSAGLDLDKEFKG